MTTFVWIASLGLVVLTVALGYIYLEREHQKVLAALEMLKEKEREGLRKYIHRRRAQRIIDKARWKSGRALTLTLYINDPGYRD